MYMAFTRFNYDESRTKKLLQECTDPGRYILNVPGPGSSLDYVSCLLYTSDAADEG